MTTRVKTKVVSVSLDCEALEWTDRRAAELHITRSRVLNQAVYSAMFESLPEPEKLKAKKSEAK